MLPYDFDLALTHTPDPAVSGDTVSVKATINRDIAGTGLGLNIYDSQTNARLKSCSSGTSCVYSFATGWQNHDLQTRRFYALVESSSTVHQIASHTVAIEAYDFDLTLTVSPDPVVVGTPATVTAAINRDLTNSGLGLHLYDAVSDEWLKGCATGKTCSYSFAHLWTDNEDPPIRRFRARVVNSHDNNQEAKSLAVPVRPYRFDLSLDFADRTVGTDGTVRYTATATASRIVDDTGYAIQIHNDVGALVASCAHGSTCPAIVPVGGEYRATVAAGSDIAGETSAYALGDDDVTELDANGFDLGHFAENFDGGRNEFCEEVMFAPYGTFAPGSTAKIEYLECEAGIRAGLSLALTVRRVALLPVGMIIVASIILQNNYDNCVSAGKCPPRGPTQPPQSTCPPDCPPPATPPAVPDSLDSEWRVDEVAHAIGKNPSLFDAQGDPLSNAAITTIASHCLYHVRRGNLGGDATETCSTLPIFVSGKDVASAAVHDIEAITQAHAPWILLNYLRGGDQIGSRGWYNSDPRCQNKLPDENCDEFPFWATEQGGPTGQPLPSLKKINDLENQLQGKLYGWDNTAPVRNFRVQCKLQTGMRGADGTWIDHGTPFIALPLPPTLGIYSVTNLCNDRNAESGG